jgi:small-conductance mechanosensitive channel
MNPEDIKNIVSGTISDYFWWLLAAAAAFYFKGVIENFVTGLSFVLSRDYNVDDEVLIGGTRKARIVRQTLTKTVFYIYDNNSRLIIPNTELHTLRCEKLLPRATEKTE